MPKAISASSSVTRPRQASDGPATLAVLLAGTFMAVMDIAIANVAGPAIQARLHLSDGGLQAVISGYTVAYAAMLITGARLGDDHGHRRVFLVGLGAFTGASLACGLAVSEPQLIGARVVQGIAAAGMVPQVITMIQLRYTLDRRARALAMFAMTISCAVVVGQVFGGALVSANLADASWRSVFLVNVPVGLGLWALGLRVLPHTRADQPRRLDLPGVVLLAVAVSLLTIALIFGRQGGWAWWIWTALGTAVIFAAAFAMHMRRLGRKGGDPLIDLALLRRGPVAMGLVALCGQMIAYGGFLLAITVHLQNRVGEGALQSGLTLASYALAFAAASLLVPRLPAAAAARAPAIGLAAMGAGYLGLALTEGGRWHQALAVGLLALAGAGFGAGYSPVISRALAAVPAANARDASGLINTTNQLGYALGIATIGSAYFSTHGGDGFGVACAACGALGLFAAFSTGALARAEQKALTDAIAVDPDPAALGDGRRRVPDSVGASARTG